MKVKWGILFDSLGWGGVRLGGWGMYLYLYSYESVFFRTYIHVLKKTDITSIHSLWKVVQHLHLHVPLSGRWGLTGGGHSNSDNKLHQLPYRKLVEVFFPSISNLQALAEGLVVECCSGAKEGSFSCRKTIQLFGTQIMRTEVAGLSFGNGYWPDKEVLLTGS